MECLLFIVFWVVVFCIIAIAVRLGRQNTLQTEQVRWMKMTDAEREAEREKEVELQKRREAIRQSVAWNSQGWRDFWGDSSHRTNP